MIPYIGFGNGTLNKCAKVEGGHKIECPHCGELHELRCGTDTETGEKSMVMFYKCGQNTYLGALNGKLVAFKKADCSGEIE